MAGNRSLGTLTVDLIAKVGGFKAGLDKAGRDAEKAAADIDKTFKTIGKNAVWAGGVLAAAFSSAASAVAAFGVQITTSFASTARELTTFASISSLSVESFQRYASVAQTVGITNEKLADQFKDVNERLGEYIATGKGPLTDFIDEYGSRVGTTAEALAKLNDPMLVLTKIVADMQSLGASDLEISFVLESLASDTTNLIPILKNGGAAMRDYIQEMEKVGFLSDDQVAAGRAVAHELDVVRGQYELLKDQIAAELSPAVIMLIRDFQDWITEGGNAESVADNLALAIDFVRVSFNLAATAIQVTNGVVRTFVADVIVAINLLSGLGKVASVANPFTAQIATLRDGPKAYAETVRSAISDVRSQFEKDINYRNTTEADAAAKAQAAWAGASKSIQDSWAGASTSAKAYNDVVQQGAKSSSSIPGVGDSGSAGLIGGINAGLKSASRLTADQIKQQAKLDEIQQRQYDTVEKQIAAERVRAQMVGETSRLAELELQIKEGLVHGTEDQLNRLREAARLQDQNTAAVDKRKEAEREAEKAARAGSAASKKAAAEAEREAKKREQEAERLKERYDNQVLALERSIYMIGKEGEAAAMAWEISKGEFKDYSEQQKQHLMLLAQNVDAAQKAFDVQKKARDEAAKKLEEEADRQEEANKAYKEYLNDVKFNLSLLGKSADEQERMNALKQLGIDADSEAGKVLTETLKIYQEQRKAIEDQVAAMDELRSGFSNALSEWVSGTKSFKDAFKDALDQVHKRIIQLISDRWTEQLFGSFGSNEPGKAGKGPVGFFGRLFGVKDPKELEGQMDALRTGEDGKEVLPYDPANIEALRAEAQRMTDGVIAVHQQAADAMAGAVGGNANAATANNQAVADSAIGNIQVTADGALESVKETGEHAQQSMDTAVQGAGSAMEGEGAGFLGRIKGMFSGIFGEGGGGFMGLFSNIFSNLGNFLTKTINSVFSSSPTGGGGAGLFSTFASMFAGGRANGGPVSAGKLYRVNENMPEMLSIGNQDFLMMGNQNGRVSNAASGGMQQVNNFVIHGRIDRRTESQIAQDVGQRTQRAINRNA